jgi:ferric-dicitrate binding protein FerR (iron transport regulator)
VNSMKNEDQHIEFREQIVKYLAGEMSLGEGRTFEELILTDKEKRLVFEESKRIWEGVNRLAARNKYNMDSEWNMLASKMDFTEKSNQTISLKSYFLRIAAVFVIGLAVLAGFIVVRNNMMYEKFAFEDEQGIIQLQDGSKVTLNEGSTLKYAVDENLGVRKVSLSGEAFFEVARDTIRPFIIDAGLAEIEVLGTSFNVRAYKNIPVVEVTVNTGLVSMLSKKTEDNLLILNPGNTGIYNKDKKELVFVSEADPNAFSWKTRELIFDEAPLSKVVDDINRIYKSNLKIADEGISDCIITVSFSDQEFSAVLNVLVSTLDLKMERKNGAIVLSGEGCN